MANVGERIAVASKGGTRSGVVTGVSGAMISVRWDSGEETNLIPAPGVLTVVQSPGATAPAKKRSGAGSRSGVAKAQAVKKSGPGDRSGAKGSSGRKIDKKTR